MDAVAINKTRSACTNVHDVFAFVALPEPPKLQSGLIEYGGLQDFGRCRLTLLSFLGRSCMIIPNLFKLSAMSDKLSSLAVVE
jgi:hypothetical protein